MQIPHQPLGDPLPRLLIVCWELLRGGGAYLAQRHANQLCKHYAVDVLVTGPSDPTFLKEFSPEIRIFTLDQTSREADAPLDASLPAFLKQYQALEPFQTTYDVLLATSIFPMEKRVPRLRPLPPLGGCSFWLTSRSAVISILARANGM